MKNQWLPNVTGYVRLKVKGKYPEMFMNRCVEQNVQVWNVKKVGNNELHCSVMLDEIWKLRRIAKASGCKFSFIQKKGFPFFLQRLKNRKGFVIGAVLFIICLFLLSNIVWGIKIEGASPEVEHELEKVIKEIGIKKGALQFKLPSPEAIQSLVTDKVTAATWIGVEKKGTTYHFQVVEKEIAEREPMDSPGHLVATRKAIIYDFFVSEGKPLIETNQLVKKGDILVSGLIGREGEEIKVAAKGKILGEMWYEAKVEVPLKRTLFVATGKKYRKHQLIIGNLPIPIYGFKQPNYQYWKEEKYDFRWELFDKVMPIYYAYTDIVETTKVKVEHEVEDAITLAKKKADEKLLSQFTKNGEIIGEKVLHHEVEDGKVKVIIHYRIVDEIGIKQPIYQGD